MEQLHREKTWPELLQAAGIKSNDPSAFIDAMKSRRSRVQWQLIDYVLENTVCSKNRTEQAMGQLHSEGLTLAQIGILKDIIAQFKIANSPPAEQQEPPLAKITVDRDVPGLTISAASPQPATRPVQERRAVINRRDELDVYRIAKHEHRRFAIPKWLDLAAGTGTELEKSDDYIYFEELKDHKGVHSAIVRGESMTETLKPGDIVIVKEMATGRLELPEIEEKKDRTPLTTWKRESQIKDGDIVIVSINGEAPTLKRIVYDTERGEKNWKMQIIADNARAWRHGRPFQVAVGDKIVFHARLIGIAAETMATKS